MSNLDSPGNYYKSYSYLFKKKKTIDLNGKILFSLSKNLSSTDRMR